LKEANGQLHALAVLLPSPIDEEAKWVQQSIWMFWKREIDTFLTGILNPFK